MSRPWRLRHKLILGLALVVVCVALLLGGALLGLSSYFRTMDTTQRKITEMQVIVQLRDAIHQIGETSSLTTSTDLIQSRPQRELKQIMTQLTNARLTLNAYEQTHQNITLQRDIDPDNGEFEAAQIERIEQGFIVLENAVHAAANSDDASVPKLIQHPTVRAAHLELMKYSTDLFGHLISDIQVSFDQSKANHRRSLYITGSATFVACILLLTLLHYFRVWVFTPIKKLQAGVARVHSGNFDNPIQLSSQDELEELADEFNAMTIRLRDIYKDLARQVNERTRQLVRSERLVSVGFLAAGVAHEINNPLASIAFCSEALEGRLQDILKHAPDDAEVIQKYLKMIQQEAFRCKQITQKLLDFSRTGGKREPVELSSLIVDVLEVAQHLPNARGKRILFQPSGQVTALLCGPDIKSVVLNMVVNALDSMEEGGTFQASLSSQGEFAEMNFQDTGCGMTSEVLNNIFEPFFTRNRTGNGTGLGLSISHQIVDQHGGTIQASSAGPGRGSQFVIRLPLRSKEAKPEIKESRPEPHLRTDERSPGRALAASRAAA